MELLTFQIELTQALTYFTAIIRLSPFYTYPTCKCFACENIIPEPQLALQSNSGDLIFTYTFDLSNNKESHIYFTMQLKNNHFSININTFLNMKEKTLSAYTAALLKTTRVLISIIVVPIM